jgi:hypothetical protein
MPDQPHLIEYPGLITEFHRDADGIRLSCDIDNLTDTVAGMPEPFAEPVPDRPGPFFPIFHFPVIYICHRDCFVTDGTCQCLLIIVIHAALAGAIQRCRRCPDQGTAVFPCASVGSVLPPVFLRNRHMVLHIMGVFMLVQVQPVFLRQRMRQTSSDEEKRKVELLFTVIFALRIGSELISFEAECHGDAGAPQMKPPVQITV